MTENKSELQSYFILYLLFVRILNLSKDIVSFLHISNFLFVNERVIEKYGRVRCINIFSDYGFCVFHLWKSIFNQPKFGTTQWNTPGYKGMPLWRSVYHIWRIKRTQTSKTRYSCTECPYPVIFASKSGLLGHIRKYHSSLFKVENVYN